MDLGLKDKRAIVTGGSRGIGRACALALAGEGARVCATARDEELLAAVVRDIEALGAEGMSVSADLTSSQGCQKVVEACEQAFGGVDILINCAGAAKGGEVLSLPVETIEEAIGLKFYACLRLSQMVIPSMRQNGWGRIVSISGMAAVNVGTRNLPASLANIAMHQLARSLSQAVARDGILVNVICPGVTDTQRARNVYLSLAEKQGRSVDDLIEDLGRKLPLGRIAQPEEIARLACFLSSEAASYISGSSVLMGQVLAV